MSKYILISHLSCDDLLQLGVGAGGHFRRHLKGLFPLSASMLFLRICKGDCCDSIFFFAHVISFQTSQKNQKNRQMTGEHCSFCSP